MTAAATARGDDAHDDLDAAILAAHAEDDRAALIALYGSAGDAAAAAGDEDAACFYWTHARVFALELGDPAADAMLTRLAPRGRDA